MSGFFSPQRMGAGYTQEKGRAESQKEIDEGIQGKIAVFLFVGLFVLLFRAPTWHMEVPRLGV